MNRFVNSFDFSLSNNFVKNPLKSTDCRFFGYKVNNIKGRLST